MIQATVITDASYCDRRKRAGWAAWVRISGQPEPIREYGSFRTLPANSTEAERLAAVNGIWLAVRAGATSILLQSDCMEVVDSIQRSTRSTPRWRAALTIALKDAAGEVTIAARHVRGHTRTQDARSYVNRWCDKHAKHAVRQERPLAWRRSV